MSAPAFYLLGALIVALAIVAVATPRALFSAYVLAAFLAATAVLSALSGGLLLALVEVVAAAVIGFGIAVLLPASGYGAMLRSPGSLSRWWSALGALAAAGGAGLVAVLARNGDGWRQQPPGTGARATLTMLARDEPLAAISGLVLIVIAVAAIALLGPVSSDERQFVEAMEARRKRQERMRRRREDRAAARRERIAAAAAERGRARR
jgi:MFS family permease